MSDEPTIQYASSDDGFLAYQVLGDGSVDLLRIDEITMTSIDSISDERHRDHFDRRLASFGRVIRFDRRGIGLSDGHSELAPLTVEQMARDALAVLDAAGSQRAAVMGAQTAMMLCSTSPGRVTHLLLFNAFARLTQADDYPWGPTQAETQIWMDTVPDPTRSSDALDDVAVLAPSLAGDPQFRAHWARSGQRGASPTVARAHMKLVFGSDVRHVLPTLDVPTLVMHRPANGLVVAEHSYFLAEQIRGARYVELPGTDFLFYGDDAEATLGEIEEFLTGVRGDAAPERVLATVLFTDVVQSTERLVDAGDRDWRVLLDRHDAMVRAQLVRFRGREVSTAGDSFFAVFDSPARAVRCAQAIVEGAGALGIDVRAGVHTGEVEVRGSDYSGIAVHIGARVAAIAGAGEVLTTGTVKDLVAGSGIAFVDRGDHTLKGVPETWHIFRAT
jgi:class 3 adenylate cyclase